jgi:hypothetical protein
LQGDAVDSNVRRVRSSLSMRVPTPTQTVHHIVFCSTSTTRSPSTNAMRVAQASVLLAQFGVSFDPFAPCRRIPRRVSPKLGSDPHARRWARAAIAASAVRTYSMIDSVDDAGSGAPSSAGRRLMRALASLASTSFWTSMCASDTAEARILDARTRVDPIVDLLAANRARSRERDARVAGALHTLTLLVGMPDIMLPTQRLQLHDDGLHARRQV